MTEFWVNGFYNTVKVQNLINKVRNQSLRLNVLLCFCVGLDRQINPQTNGFC